MRTTDLFKKHFGNVPGVDMKHPNMEKFFEELNLECFKEDLEKIEQGLTESEILQRYQEYQRSKTIVNAV